jgi:hypothetical protein
VDTSVVVVPWDWPGRAKGTPRNAELLYRPADSVSVVFGISEIADSWSLGCVGVDEFSKALMLATALRGGAKDTTRSDGDDKAPDIQEFGDIIVGDSVILTGPVEEPLIAASGDDLISREC